LQLALRCLSVFFRPETRDFACFRFFLFTSYEKHDFSAKKNKKNLFIFLKISTFMEQSIIKKPLGKVGTLAAFKKKIHE